MVSTKKNDEAVSPVIGVILLVAITVILAAIIASYVFGSSSNIQKTKVVAAGAQLDSSGTLVIIYQGGQDDLSLSSLIITAPNGTLWHLTDSDGTIADSGSTFAKPNIGTVMKLYPAPDWPNSQRHVVVVGNFNDGASQVITDTFV